MARTDISICARALVELGAAPINSFDTPGDVAAALKIIYPELKASIIASYQWECMKVRTSLTQASEDPGGYQYAYVMPGDMEGAPTAVFTDNSCTRSTTDFEIRARRIVSNYSALWCEYSAQRPEDQWPAWFAELVYSAVAASIAFLVTDQQNVKDYWEQKAYGTPQEAGTGGLMGKAMTLDAQGSGNNPGIADTAFVDARFGNVYPGEQWP